MLARSDSVMFRTFYMNNIFKKNSISSASAREETRPVSGPDRQRIRRRTISPNGRCFQATTRNYLLPALISTQYGFLLSFATSVVKFVLE